MRVQDPSNGVLLTTVFATVLLFAVFATELGAKSPGGPDSATVGMSNIGDVRTHPSNLTAQISIHPDAKYVMSAPFVTPWFNQQGYLACSGGDLWYQAQYPTTGVLWGDQETIANGTPYCTSNSGERMQWEGFHGNSFTAFLCSTCGYNWYLNWTWSPLIGEMYYGQLLGSSYTYPPYCNGMANVTVTVYFAIWDVTKGINVFGNSYSQVFSSYDTGACLTLTGGGMYSWGADTNYPFFNTIPENYQQVSISQVYLTSGDTIQPRAAIRVDTSANENNAPAQTVTAMNEVQWDAVLDQMYAN